MISAYAHRAEAGRDLAEKLLPYKDRSDVIVLALPRGGVPVAYEVARALGAPLDIFLVRKLGVPGHEELAMGAIASGETLVLNHDVLQMFGISDQQLRQCMRKEQVELKRREKLYRGARPPPPLQGRTVIVVDDGLATGSTMQAAVSALRQRGPARIVVAVPVGAVDTCAAFRGSVDDIVCARTPAPFFGVGRWYKDFSQTTDEEVRDLLSRAQSFGPTETRRAAAGSRV
jgi:putative phosphoribosyl transferase